MRRSTRASDRRLRFGGTPGIERWYAAKATLGDALSHRIAELRAHARARTLGAKSAEDSIGLKWREVIAGDRVQKRKRDGIKAARERFSQRGRCTAAGRSPKSHLMASRGAVRCVAFADVAIEPSAGDGHATEADWQPSVVGTQRPGGQPGSEQKAKEPVREERLTKVPAGRDDLDPGPNIVGKEHVIDFTDNAWVFGQ